MKEQLEKIAKWLAEDVNIQQPTLTSSIFSAKDLKDAMGLDWSDAFLREVFIHLEEMQIITPTNKVGPDGIYYNIHPQVVIHMRPNQADGIFVADMKTPEEGFCFVYGADTYEGDKPRRVYRQTCAGRNCKFYFATEKRCVKGKFFLE